VVLDFLGGVFSPLMDFLDKVYCSSQVREFTTDSELVGAVLEEVDSQSA
jgi:hypothetical protein